MDGQTNGGVFNPKNLGLFTYTYNNPVNFIDPNGEFTLKELKFAFNYPSHAWKINPPIGKGLSNVAAQVAVMGPSPSRGQFYQNVDGGKANAIRHATLASHLTAMYGDQVASAALNAHEEGSTEITSQTIFKDLPSADKAIDLRNNEIGKAIGKKYKTYNGINAAKKVIEEFKDNGLWTAKKLDSGQYQIEKTKISNDEYTQFNRALNYKNYDASWKKGAEEAIRQEGGGK